MNNLQLAAEVPKITDWMQAWGTILGAAFAALAAVAAALLLLHERRAREADRYDTDARQARLIFARITLDGGNFDAGMTGVRYEVKNWSDGPIFGLSLNLSRIDHLGGSYYHDPLIDLTPGDSLSGRWILDPPIRWPQGHPPLEYIETWIFFMDSAGNIWQRDDRQPPKRHRPGRIKITFSD